MYALILQIFRGLYLLCKQVPGNSLHLVIHLQDTAEICCGIFLGLFFSPPKHLISETYHSTNVFQFSSPFLIIDASQFLGSYSSVSIFGLFFIKAFCHVKSYLTCD